MKWKAMQNNGVGKLPEYGAIFMSNILTKKESLRQKLFGLSSRHISFVEHIKVGMILFLFEYERRELYGVFQACSDGGIDIDPCAFSISGKRYPAQVKVKCLWVCHPLPECEFRDAIKENYTTGNKFSFGLSEAQVRKLLCLFRSKVLRGPERQLTKNGKSKLVVPSMEDVRQVDGSRSKGHDRLNSEHAFGFNNMDTDLGEAMTTGYQLQDNIGTEQSKYQFAGAERVPNDGGFLNNEFHDKSNRVNGFELRPSASTEFPHLDKVEQIDSKLRISGRGRSDYCLYTPPPSAAATQYSGYSCGNVQRARCDGGLMTNYNFQKVHQMDNVLEPPVRSPNSSLLQSQPGGSSFLGITNSLVPDQIITKPPSQAHHGMESQLFSSLSSKASYGDATILSTHPNDSVPSFPKYQYPLSNEVNYQSTAAGYKPDYGCSENVILSSMQQPSLPHPTPNGVNGSLDMLSSFGNRAFSGPSHTENAYRGTTIRLSQPSQNLDVESKKNQSSDGLSFFSAGMSSQRGGINWNDSMFSEDSFNTSLHSSLLDNHEYPIEPVDQLLLEAAQRRKIRESLMGNLVSESEDPFKVQGYDPENPQLYEHNSFEYDHEHYQSSDAYYSDSHKDRTSVFSRLSLASDEYPPELDASVSYVVNDRSMSGDGVMNMLHKSHQRWVMPKKLKQRSRKDDEEKQKDKKQDAAFCDALLSKRSAKDIKLDHSLAVDSSLAGIEQAILCQSTEAEPFLNFKRRSEIRKRHDDGTTSFCDASSRLEVVPGWQQNKRKLVRPNFSKNGSSFDNSDVRSCTSVLQAPVKEVSFINDTTGRCDASLGNQDDEKRGFYANQPNQGDASSRLKDVLVGQQKKRKLVRPNFSNNASYGNSDVLNCSSVLQAPVKEVSFINHTTGRCDASLGNQDDEKRGFSANQADQGDGAFERKTKQSHINSIGVQSEAGKESSMDAIGVRNETLLGKHEAKIPNILKHTDCSDSNVEGSSNNCDIASHSLEQIPELGLPNKGAETGKQIPAENFERNNSADILVSAPFVDETCINNSLCASINEINKVTGADTFHVSVKKHSEGTLESPKSPLGTTPKRRKLKRE